MSIPEWDLDTGSDVQHGILRRVLLLSIWRPTGLQRWRIKRRLQHFGRNVVSVFFLPRSQLLPESLQHNTGSNDGSADDSGSNDGSGTECTYQSLDGSTWTLMEACGSPCNCPTPENPPAFEGDVATLNCVGP